MLPLNYSKNIFAFLVKLAVWLKGWPWPSVSQSTTMVHTEIFQQLLDVLPWNLVQTFMFPSELTVQKMVTPTQTFRAASVARLLLCVHTQHDAIFRDIAVA